MRQAGRVASALAILLTVYPPTRLPAQTPDSSHVQVAAPAAAPDTSHLIKPVGALWRSLLVPGWGQAAAGRGTTGALFVVWEGVTIMMTARAVQEVHYMEETGSANVDSKRQQIQDWAILWGFNHLFAGAEAFVSAHLQDFPKELKVRATPSGIGVSLPLP